MASKFTPDINEQNVQNIRAQIQSKKEANPYLATVNQSAQVITDYDTFPYPRWFRGVPNSDRPIVAEREAGWRPRHDNCYRIEKPYSSESNYPNHCFEGPCSVVYPCYPKYLQKFSDREALNVMLNNACTIQYR